MRPVAVQDFRHLSEPARYEMIAEARKPLAGPLPRLGRAFVDLDICGDEWTDQPRPYGPLVIRRIAADHSAFVSRTVLRIARRQTPQPGRREQVAFDHCNYLLGE